MKRRNFLKVAGVAGGLTLSQGFAGLALSGCSTSNLKAYLNIVLNSAEKILALGFSTDSWYANLSAAITALEATESDWSASSAVSAVISALDAIEAVLAVIPVTSAYSSLIDLLVTVIETILTTFVSATKPAAIPKALAGANPHRGRIPLNAPHFLQSKVGAYKEQWNEIVKSDPNLASAKM